MDSLQSAYKDDDEEWRDALDRSPSPSPFSTAAASSPPPPPIDTSAPPPLIAASSPPPGPIPALSTSPPLPPSSTSPGSPAEQLHEEDNNHSPSPPEPSIPAGATGATAAISDDDEDGSPSRKKQKPLSTFTTPVSAPPPSAGVTIKKPKKKNNNVWTKSTSRKGKKKNKNGANGSTASAVAPAQDAVLITPIPRFPDKSDDTPDAVICLSRVYKAEKVELGEDRLSASSAKGYRMVRATRGVEDGAWYFEIKVVRLGETGHTRLGWTTNKGDLQAPVGYDGNSYGYRDIDGCKIHKALRTKCGEEGYKEGDVIGFYINLPEGELYAPKPPNLVWYKGQRYMYTTDGKDEPAKAIPGSEISFFKNGIRQGVGFTDICGGRYYPAASMYTQVRPNQPNCEVRFNFGPDFEFFPEDFGGRPTPRPMIEVPYHGFEGRVEVPTENGCNPEQTS